MERSACGVSVSLSVELLRSGERRVGKVGGVTVAVLLSVPVAVALIVPVAVNTTDAPEASSTVVLMLPEPLAPFVAVQLTLVNVLGNMSVTVAPVTALGPLLVTVIV